MGSVFSRRCPQAIVRNENHAFTAEIRGATGAFRLAEVGMALGIKCYRK